MKGTYKNGKVTLEMDKSDGESWLALIEKYISDHEDDPEFLKELEEEDEA